jgi:hypothetical protein
LVHSESVPGTKFRSLPNATDHDGRGKFDRTLPSDIGGDKSELLDRLFSSWEEIEINSAVLALLASSGTRWFSVTWLAVI